MSKAGYGVTLVLGAALGVGGLAAYQNKDAIAGLLNKDSMGYVVPTKQFSPRVVLVPYNTLPKGLKEEMKEELAKYGMTPANPLLVGKEGLEKLIAKETDEKLQTMMGQVSKVKVGMYNTDSLPIGYSKAPGMFFSVGITLKEGVPKEALLSHVKESMNRKSQDSCIVILDKGKNVSFIFSPSSKTAPAGIRLLSKYATGNGYKINYTSIGCTK